MLCFRESDGNFFGKPSHDELSDEIVKEARVEGIASTPAVEGNRLYYVSNRCEVICADTEGFLDGKTTEFRMKNIRTRSTPISSGGWT